MCCNSINLPYSNNCALTCSKEIEAVKMCVRGRQFYVIDFFFYYINSDIDTFVLFQWILLFHYVVWLLFHLVYKLKENNFIIIIKLRLLKASSCPVNPQCVEQRCIYKNGDKVSKMGRGNRMWRRCRKPPRTEFYARIVVMRIPVNRSAWVGSPRRVDSFYLYSGIKCSNWVELNYNESQQMCCRQANNMPPPCHRQTASMKRAGLLRLSNRSRLLSFIHFKVPGFSNGPGWTKNVTRVSEEA